MSAHSGQHKRSIEGTRIGATDEGCTSWAKAVSVRTQGRKSHGDGRIPASAPLCKRIIEQFMATICVMTFPCFSVVRSLHRDSNGIDVARAQ